MAMPRLQVIRGLPGTLKTHTAHIRYPHLFHVETDYHLISGGVYNYSNERYFEAKDWFNLMVGAAISHKIDFVVTGVFPTCNDKSHLAQVVKCALNNGYEVWIQTMKKSVGSAHNVPASTMRAMSYAMVTNKEVLDYFCSSNVHLGLMPKEFSVERVKL